MASNLNTQEFTQDKEDLSKEFQTFGIQETECPSERENHIMSENKSGYSACSETEDRNLPSKDEFGNTQPLALHIVQEETQSVSQSSQYSGVMETQTNPSSDSLEKLDLHQCSELPVENTENGDRNLAGDECSNVENFNDRDLTEEHNCDFDTKGSNCASDTDSESEYLSAEEENAIAIDEQGMLELEKSLTEEEKNERRGQAQAHKEDGNKLFKEQNYKEAVKSYGKALRLCPVAFPKDRSIMYSNRAACWLRMEQNDQAIVDCTSALDLHPHYLKALLRRAQLYEKSEKLDESLADYQKVLELDPYEHTAREACVRLPELIKERNEKMKEEMMGKLKDLGNMILRPFGLSTNNFRMEQNADTGGYSVSFQQNPDNGK